MKKWRLAGIRSTWRHMGYLFNFKHINNMFAGHPPCGMQMQRYTFFSNHDKKEETLGELRIRIR